MPELPEVETTVRGLARLLVGHTIRDVWTDWPRMIQGTKTLRELRKMVKGKKVVAVRRRAKFIVIDLRGGDALFVHQKISGHLLYGKWKKRGDKLVSILPGPMRDDPKNRHIRFLLSFINGFQLALCDLRRFGRVTFVSNGNTKLFAGIHRLGPEPLDISISDFRKLFTRKKGRIKQVLMDPFFIVGIGNIYADEILWDVGLHPEFRVESLSTRHLNKLYYSMQRILSEAITLQGSSLDDYRTPQGEQGSYQTIHHAYHKTGLACDKRDGGVIQRKVIAGRSAHFCPVHQMLQ